MVTEEGISGSLTNESLLKFTVYYESLLSQRRRDAEDSYTVGAALAANNSLLKRNRIRG